MNIQEYDIVVPSETDFKLITKTQSDQLWWYQNDTMNVLELRNFSFNVSQSNTWVDLNINVPTSFNSNYSVTLTINIGRDNKAFFTIRILNNKIYVNTANTGSKTAEGTLVYPRQDKMP